MSYMNRRTLIRTAVCSLPLFGGLGTTIVAGSNDPDHCTVTIEHIDDAFEGESVQIDFSVHNPTNEQQHEDIKIARGSQNTIHENLITMDPGESIEGSTIWHVPDDAAGHVMEITLSGEEDQDTELINGRSHFRPTIKSASRQGSRDPPSLPGPQESKHAEPDQTGIKLEYEIQNTGTAPDSHEITIAHNGSAIDTTEIWLGIGSQTTKTVTIYPVQTGENKLTVSTESSKDTETVWLFRTS